MDKGPLFCMDVPPLVPGRFWPAGKNFVKNFSQNVRDIPEKTKDSPVYYS